MTSITQACGLLATYQHGANFHRLRAMHFRAQAAAAPSHEKERATNRAAYATAYSMTLDEQLDRVTAYVAPILAAAPAANDPA